MSVRCESSHHNPVPNPQQNQIGLARPLAQLLVTASSAQESSNTTSRLLTESARSASERRRSCSAASSRYSADYSRLGLKRDLRGAGAGVCGVGADCPPPRCAGWIVVVSWAVRQFDSLFVVHPALGRAGTGCLFRLYLPGHTQLTLADGIPFTQGCHESLCRGRCRVASFQGFRGDGC